MTLAAIVNAVVAWLKGDGSSASTAIAVTARAIVPADQPEIQMPDAVNSTAATSAPDRVTTALQIAFALKNITPAALDAAVHAATIAALDVLFPATA